MTDTEKILSAIGELAVEVKANSMRLDSMEGRMKSMEQEQQNTGKRLDAMEKNLSQVRQELSSVRGIAERVEDRVNSYDAEAVLSAVCRSAELSAARAANMEHVGADVERMKMELARTQGDVQSVKAVFVEAGRKLA